jgi:hypothetical protein
LFFDGNSQFKHYGLLEPIMLNKKIKLQHQQVFLPLSVSANLASNHLHLLVYSTYYFKLTKYSCPTIMVDFVELPFRSLHLFFKLDRFCSFRKFLKTWFTLGFKHKKTKCGGWWRNLENLHIHRKHFNTKKLYIGPHMCYSGKHELKFNV